MTPAAPAAGTALVSWPYPFWIAHRGAGRLAPENTLPAFALGAAHGWRMFECDAKLSRDGQVFLLHDDCLERTSNGSGAASACRMAELALLDAGSWHSSAYAGTPIATLQALVEQCQAQGWWLNVEIKPSPGQEQATGAAVAQLLARLWRVGAPPLLSSFAPTALAAARGVAPTLPRALLLDAGADFAQALTQAQALDCQAMVLHQQLCRSGTIARVHVQGMRCLSFTVNQARRAQQLQAAGIDGLISDAITRLDPRRLPLDGV